MSHNILIIPDFYNRSVHFQKVNMFLVKLSSKVHILKVSLPLECGREFTMIMDELSMGN